MTRRPPSQKLLALTFISTHTQPTLLITHAVKMTEAQKKIIRGVPQLPDAVVSDKVPASKDEELGACPDSPKLWSPRALLLLPRRQWLGHPP